MDGKPIIQELPGCTVQVPLCGAGTLGPTDLSIVRKGTHNYQPSTIAADTVNIWQWWCDKGKC